MSYLVAQAIVNIDDIEVVEEIDIAGENRIFVGGFLHHAPPVVHSKFKSVLGITVGLKIINYA